MNLLCLVVRPFALHRSVIGIKYGLQNLNVYVHRLFWRLFLLFAFSARKSRIQKQPV